MGQDYRGLFQAWELAIATKLVREFRATSHALQREEIDDLLQEVLLHWYYARGSHDPQGKASIRTYMTRVVRNKLIDLLRERESDKQIVNILTLPSDIAHGDESGRDTSEAEPKYIAKLAASIPFSAILMISWTNDLLEPMFP